MRTVVELVHIDCEDPLSILNIVDNKQKTIRKQLRIHIQNCKKTLDDVDSLLKRYAKMSATNKLAWAWKGNDEMNDLASNLSSFATQLDSFVNGLTLKGVAAIYQQQRKLQKGIGRVEEALGKSNGNSVAAVCEVMHEVDQAVDQGNVSPGSTERYKSIISDYAQEVSRSITFAKPRASTSDPGRGRGDSHGRLNKPLGHNRAASADTSKSDKTLNVKGGRSVEGRALVDNKPKNELKRWQFQNKVNRKERLKPTRYKPTQEQHEKETAQREIKAKATAKRQAEQREERQRKTKGDLIKKAASIEKLKQENKSLKARNEKANKKIATKKTNNLEARNEGPHHPDNAIESKGSSATNKAVKGVNDQSKIDKQQEAQGNVTAKTGDPSPGDRSKVISPKKPCIKEPKDRSTVKLKDPCVKEEIKVQTRMETGQQQGRNSMVNPGESSKTERAMAKKDSPLSRQKSPRIDAKANKQDGHPDSKSIKQEKANKQGGHPDSKPIKQGEAKKQDYNTNTKPIKQDKANKQDDHPVSKPIKQGEVKKQDSHINAKSNKQEKAKKQDNNDQQEASA